MRTFKKLEIKGEKEDLVNFLKEIKSKVYDNFTYMSDKSDDYAMMISLPKEYTATFLSNEIERAIAYVWLVISDNLLYVANITPNKSGQLTYNQYNSIISKFCEEVVKSDTIKDISINLSKEDFTIEDFAGADTALKLKNWINSANLSTLNTNHYDFKRWCDFIFTSHLTKSQLTSSQFEKFLIEDVKLYDEDLVSKIVQEYEYSLDILKEYDKHRGF
ncbi:hypothetical protein [Flavobacterium aquicola]|uniref:Uncharacterized protein n=1 Tax=Flavobacterium aquicola TaxID=1682742 RepID=A0A3E0DY22_9FLAO|nr:hypothetical protein [Flavobacterium aquicola]REG90250.1 hypothetical protein C8P67_12710 [Flavobacterium aquicola]